MNGFVPVTKQSLLTMVQNSREALQADFDEKYQNRIDKYISREETRVNSRRWYRLWLKPKPRFLATVKGVEEYSTNCDYEMWGGCPLQFLKADFDYSTRWLNRLKNLATSEFSGDPIQLDLKTFQRLSTPYKYNWVNIGIFYTLR